MKVRTDAGDVHVRNAALAIPARLPLGERDDPVVSPVASHVGGRGPGERLSGMDEWRLDEGRAGLSRGPLEWADPFARDRVHEIRAREGVPQILWVDQRGRQ